VETYPAFLGEEFLDELDAARKNTTFVDPAGMTDDCRSRGRQLFAMLNSWTQELTVATKIARGIREQNGWEFWRLLWRELAPDNHSKNLVWRRALLSPKFPTKITKEVDFSPALQEWEADLDKHEAEFGQAKAMSDEDKRAVVLTEAPTALKQHLSMHIGTLTTYQYVHEVVVSYLQAKQVWKPSAAYAGAAARKNPDAMEIGQIGHGKGRGKGKNGKGKEGKNGKGKKQKGKTNIATAAERVAKTVTARTDAPSVGKQAIRQRSVGSIRKAKKRVSAVAEGDTSSVVSLGISSGRKQHHHSPILDAIQTAEKCR